MLTIENRDELRRDAALRPLIERSARALWASEVRQVICRPARDMAGLSWIVLRSGVGGGMALWAEEHFPCVTELRRAVVQVRCLAAIAGAFGGARTFPLELSAEREPPLEWPRYATVVGGAECMFALSPELQGASFWGKGLWGEAELGRGVAQHKSTRVRVALRCDLPTPGHEGIRVPDVRVRVEGRGIAGGPVSGWLRYGEGGSMFIEIGEGTGEGITDKALVQVGLGSIELTLEELLSLRPGSVIDIGIQGPLACTLSVGATELVQGVLEPSQAGFLLRVTNKS